MSLCRMYVTNVIEARRGALPSRIGSGRGLPYRAAGSCHDRRVGLGMIKSSSGGGPIQQWGVQRASVTRAGRKKE